MELTTAWYHRRIVRLLTQIDQLACDVLPVNRVTTSMFMTSLDLVDIFVSGLTFPTGIDKVDWESDALFKQFRDHIDADEAYYQRALRTVAYYLDDENTLLLIARRKQPEKVCFSFYHSMVISL